MRTFSSYGPVDAEVNFAVERKELVERCVERLVGEDPKKGGHYFTIWGARQTGKTWIMRRAVEEIRERYADRFTVGWLSVEGILGNDPTEQVFFSATPSIFRHGKLATVREVPHNWDEWQSLFEVENGILDHPTILLIDEFDCLPPALIDEIVRVFRRIYLNRAAYHLHGLALIGVRAVLGLDSPRGSPFNVQRSLQIPNLTRDEVVDMFRQYQVESGQAIEPQVVQAVYDSTRGQPGLVSWFGELLTEKHNPGKDKTISFTSWRNVYRRALYSEWNNTLLNLIKKARGEHRPHVMKLFTDPNVSFSIREDWCNFLFMNGIIDETLVPDPENPSNDIAVCRFSSPFVQESLFTAFSADMFSYKGPILPLEVLDTLADVFTSEGIHAPRLLARYRDYLKRLKVKGIDPWIGQPRRQDLQYTEAVGHFHLYAWLMDAVGRRCSVSPEFPTGNGKVDLVLRKQEHAAVIEVKSFRDMSEMESHRKQAAGYAKKLGLAAATLALFAPVEDEAILATLSSETQVDGVLVTTVAFGWV